jgi:hypothetical protein
VLIARQVGLANLSKASDSSGFLIYKYLINRFLVSAFGAGDQSIDNSKLKKLREKSGKDSERRKEASQRAEKSVPTN